MKHAAAFLALSFLLPPAAVAQAGAVLDPATQITAEEVLEHIEVLSSDLFEGREAATQGERRAAAYIVAALEECERLQPGGVDGGWLQPFELQLRKETKVAHNIIAKLPGSDPGLAHEVIVLGAHYDHVGYGHSGNAIDGAGEIHNGADDNASGSSVLLDLATSLANSEARPRRTILFQWYSGEELGLLGSKHWVENPLLPLEHHVFMINMDMVGRLVARTLVVGGTGTSPGLADLARGFCEELGLVMIDDPPGTAPSDNSSFYDKRIPALFLFTGLHPQYHRATDDSVLVNAKGAADIGRLAQRILLAIDARDERPEFTVAPGNAYMFSPVPWVGATFSETRLPVAEADPASAPPAIRVTVCIPDSPAWVGGLRDGDLITAVDGQPVADISAFERRLKQVGDALPPIPLTVLRDGEAAPLDLVVQPIVK